MSPIQIIFPILFIILGPFVGGLMDGIDRKLSARLQGRIGPSILQPFYDVRKLMNKQVIGVNRAQYALLLSYLLLMIVTGLLFFSGSDILMSVFVLSTASIFLYFAVVETGSPYNTIASNRELVQIMAYEPAVILMCVGFYLVAGSVICNRFLQKHYVFTANDVELIAHHIHVGQFVVNDYGRIVSVHSGIIARTVFLTFGSILGVLI